MSTGIFELDEERENSNDTTLGVKRESSPSPSPRSSPPPADAARQSSSASAGHGQSQPPPSLQIPTPGQPNLFSPAPQYTSNLARKHGASFAATPSFPSPLAQAITVPSHSDTSSSSSHSDGEDDHSDTAPVSPTRSNASGTPKRQVELLPRPRTASPHTSRSNSPSSSQKSASRPPSPSRQAVLTPSSLLMAKKRSSGAGLAAQSVIAVAPIKRDSPPRATQSATATPSRLSPTSATSPRQIASNRGNPMASPSIESTSPTDSRRRTSSGSNASLGVPSYSSPSMPGASSPLAFGSFDLSPQHRGVGEASVPSTRRRSVTSRTGSVSSGHSPVRETKDPSNILGLGWGGTWESGSSSSGSVSGNVRENKGKAKEGAAGQGGLSSGPPSPRISTRERERTAPAGSNVGSPSRQRRPSEFLNPTALDARKMPIMGAGRAGNNHAPSLSTSASMISPLNPLPSPWSTGDHSPFSPPTSEQSISTSMSSVGGGAIRLNRVPTSVRMAADLLKPSSPAAAPAAIPTANSTTVPTPNPSPAGSVPSTSSMPPPPPPNRTLGHFPSMPEPSSKPSTGLGLIDTTTKGRSSGLRRPSVDLSPTAGSDARQSGTVLVDLTNRRSTSGSSLAPPTSFKDPVPAVKSTVAVQSDSASVTSRPEPFSQNARTHRYRTSMHEATFKRPLDLTDPPALWTASSASGSSTSSGQNNTEPPTATADKKGSMGLGLNMPPGLARTSSSINTGPGTHGSAQTGLHQPTQRFRSVTTKGLQMDLAGIPNLSDAASHASMIMQSRQAKLQRWRPSSSGSNSAGGDSLPPAFHRSTTSATPAMLAAPRVGRQTEWGLQIPPIATSAVSSPGEDLPPFPSALRDTNPGSDLDSTPALGSRIAGGSPVKSNSGPSRFASPPSALPELGVSMERAHSGSGSVAGIEWVDWYDCYKGYKEAKIRAEAQTANLGGRPLQSGVHNPEGTSPNANTPSTSPEMPESIGTMGAREIDLTSNYDNSSAVALTPQTSRDDAALGQGQIRKRSMSIRSTLSSMDPTKSPRQHRTSIFERPRQSSGSSVRSTAVDSGVSSGVKKKKNLVNKMEGWWSAVKSNFIPENQQNIQQIRANNLGVYPQQRIPSAPASRRGSGNSPIAPPPTALLAPNPTRRASGQSVRQVISHAELRPKNTEHEAHRLQAAASIISSTSADIAKLSRQSSLRSTASNLLSASQTLGRKPSIVPEETSPSRATETLESRRKGNFNLRLDLESNVISRPTSRVALSSGESSSQKKTATVSAGGPNRPSQTSSRSTSYGQPLTGPGLTPGLPKWDQTPSPIFALDTAESTSRGDKEDRPVAPGAEITVANVRRHIKRRLDAAKATCDTTLRKSIEAITKFAEQQRAGEQSANLALAAATSALITGESNGTEPKDYFEAMSDSPLVDAEDSDFEGLDTLSNHLAGRHASSSRPSSRRPSISITAGSSPTKRLAMLPTSPSRVRRRPSNQPQSFPGQHRISRNLSLSLDRTASASSSRSTSRSRSPLPLSRPIFSGPSDDAADGDRQFLSALQELIVLATEVSDSSVTALAAKPGTCSDLIQKLQRVGMNWDEHDDWPGREWYVDILMAVANLSRVLDWWEAEKGFWNFGDEDENEPIMFVMKPGGQMKEDSRFDREFGAALTDRRTSPAGLPGNDLLQVPEPPSTASTVEMTLVDSVPGTAKQGDGTPKAVTADDLKALAEQAKSVNIVMELSLQGEEIQYVNDAIMEVIGREPEDVLNCPITELLAPADASVFSEATHKLLEDDSNTIQCRFRFEVHDLESGAHPPLQPGPVYIELEGAGMLMREQNEPSHTMWVLKPVTATKAHMDSISEAIFPRDGVISTEGILCRICEREIVTWFFEKHNETCDAVHRLEAEILSCNECLHDLGQTISKLSAELNEIAVPVEGQTPAGQGVVFFTFPDSLTDGDEATVPSEPQGIEVRKVEVDHVQEVCNIVSMASQIEVPVVQEDEADLPFHVQRYLSKESEEKLQRLTRWQRPPTNDRALSLLLTQVEEQIRRKNKAIARMQSTIRYSEKTRHEWEDKVNQMFADGDEASPSESGSGSDLGGDGPQSPSSPEGGELANQQAQAPDVSPPGYRKIAPQARLPITQSHPQRPSTGHGAETSSMLNAPPTPHAFGTPRTTVPVPSSATLPSQSTLLPTSHIPPPTPLPPTGQGGTSETGLSPHLSPGLMPFEPIGHARRASSSRAFRDPLLSPRIPSAALHSRAPAPSIKDFEIIKPISRGAFGSVYLAKKVATGDYFAIKALKKSDMIAKNQITNVKAERTILMNQASSPYVAKLFFSFQSKDYLYLVMEYLNGGDCANLVKTLGGLSEDWARNYIAEVVLGLEYLHARNIVHRDIKPDNLLIDSRGHLKLTDFGLSRIGLLNRQVGGPRPAFLRGTSLRASSKGRFGQQDGLSSSPESPMLSPELDMLPAPQFSNLSQSYFTPTELGSADESSGSESAGIIPKHMRTLSMATKSTEAKTPPRFVGTPDYLAPESILGIGTDDKAVDWWALGVVMYEFLYGVPPFHAETPEKVFDNVVSRRINWYEEEIDVSPAARDLMDRLMCSDPLKRLGARGADEVKEHAFFAEIDWKTVMTSEASFVPDVTDPESTDYFDKRGATHGFHDDDSAPAVLKQPEGRIIEANSPVVDRETSAIIDDMASQDDFGTFEYKNLPVLKQANDEMIRKLRTDSLVPLSASLEAAPTMTRRPRSLSIKLRDRARRKLSDSAQPMLLGGPPSPATSASSAASTPSRAGVQPSTPSAAVIQHQHFRRPSELNALDRVKSTDESEIIRRSSAPTRIRAGSGGSSTSDQSTSMDLWRKKRQVSLNAETPPLAVLSVNAGSPESHSGISSQMGDRTLDILIAEDNPISQKILETLLTRMGCRCVCVEDGPQALAATMGSIRFDVIICDIHMPVVNGEQVARMIRSTNNHNQNTPIIACTSYEQHPTISEEGTLFSAVLAKPVTKTDIVKCLGKLGFVLSSTGSTSSAGTDASTTYPSQAYTYTT